jgi:hypothetical protein
MRDRSVNAQLHFQKAWPVPKNMIFAVIESQSRPTVADGRAGM